MVAHEQAVRVLEEELKKNFTQFGEIEAALQNKKTEMYNHIKATSKKPQKVGFFDALASIFTGVTNTSGDDDSEAAAKTQVLSSELSQLAIEKSSLLGKEWSIQVRMTDMQLKLACMKIENGSIPDPVHLNDVQQCLSRIQNILIQLQKFWESVSVMLESLKDETFANEHFIEEQDLKEMFLDSINTAKEHWKVFGESCLYAKSIFSLQTKDAYKFLETSPSTLTPEQWTIEYETVIEDLKKINPDPFKPKEPATITP